MLAQLANNQPDELYIFKFSQGPGTNPGTVKKNGTYFVDNGNSRLYRVRVDATGTATAQPELLAELPTNIATVQFGAGPGFDPRKVYVTGNPGTVYAIPVGIGCAPIPLPAR